MSNNLVLSNTYLELEGCRDMTQFVLDSDGLMVEQKALSQAWMNFYIILMDYGE